LRQLFTNEGDKFSRPDSGVSKKTVKKNIEEI